MLDQTWEEYEHTEVDHDGTAIPATDVFTYPDESYVTRDAAVEPKAEPYAANRTHVLSRRSIPEMIRDANLTGYLANSGYGLAHRMT